MEKIRYVVGFAFSTDEKVVLLIEKQKPEWQRGLLNGIGGKIEAIDALQEPGKSLNSSVNAMVREFEEEAGLRTVPDDWTFFCTLEGEDFQVFCFHSHLEQLHEADTQTEEKVIFIFLGEKTDREMVQNASWLIAMAMSSDDIYPPVVEYRRGDQESGRLPEEMKQDGERYARGGDKYP